MKTKALLLVAIVFMLAFLSDRYGRTWDLTQNGRNSLSDVTVGILGKMEGPVRITSYASKNDPKFGNVQEKVKDFIAPYRRAKPDISLDFVDPVEEPKLAEKADVAMDGEMVVRYGNKSGHLRALNEEAFANLLIRLSRKEGRLVMALSGHGERKLDGMANFDLGDFGKALVRNGFATSSLNLALAQDLPENMSLLLVTSPQIDLLPGEVMKIEAYVRRGGNLLWLIDQENDGGEPLHGLQPLADRLGLVLTPGTVIDPASEKLNAPENWALGTLYGSHPVTRNFDLVTVFPFARQIGVNERRGWHVTPLVEAAQNGRLTVGSEKGPFTVAIAMERNVNGRDQRVAIVGTGEFLANTYAGNGGNM
ncbi:MAG TPA: GldG family protein, partial [Burkholderiales bacterium]|nr:GldG family protein [Burkholderiales bacterium]